MTRNRSIAISLLCLVLPGCATTEPFSWLDDDHAVAIAEDLSLVVADRWPPGDSVVHVGAMPLRTQFERAIRAQGYAVVNESDGAVRIEGIGSRVPPNTWHIGLTIDEDISIGRLYQIERGGVQALSSISVIDHTVESVSSEMVGASQWEIRRLTQTLHEDSKADVIEDSSTKPLLEPIQELVSGSFLPDAEQTAPVPVATTASDCPSEDGAVFTFSPGSLKQALAAELERCGWTISHWPVESRDPHLIVDWIVAAETLVQLDSLEDLLLGLNAIYGLEGTLDQAKRRISFSMSLDK